MIIILIPILILLLLFLLVSPLIYTNYFTNMSQQPLEILVINLDRSKFRLEKIDEMFRGSGLTYTRVQAVDGSKYKTVEELTASEGYKDLLCLGGEDRKGHLPHTGCYLSHLKCLKMAREFDRTLILEDDAEFIIDDLKKVLNEIPENIDFVWLNADNHEKVEEDNNMPTWGTTGYIVSKKAAIVLYDMLKPDSDYINGTKDCLVDWVMPEAIKYSRLTWKHYTLVKQRAHLKSNISDNFAYTDDDELIIKPVVENTFYKKKSHFIHIPKTGGTSVMSYAKGVNYIIHRKIGPRDNYNEGDYVYTIIRDPYDRFESAFWHHKTLDSPDHFWKKLDAPRSNIRFNFKSPNDFIEAIDDINNPLHKIAMKDFNQIHFKRQVDFLTDDYGNIDSRINKFYIYSKNLSNDLGINAKVINKTPNHEKIELNEHSKEFIRKYYSRDFDLINSKR